MTFLNNRWKIAQPPPRDHLERFQDHDPLLIQVLYNRNIRQPADVEAFLNHKPAAAGSAMMLKGIEVAIERIGRAIRQGESIAIYGDYDADGVTATVLLTQALRAMGAGRVQPYIPDRINEGYGLNNSALAKLAEDGNKLVITVDCGIRAVDEITYANELGLDVIVTDHHTTGPQLPPAVSIIDPKQAGDTYPDRYLAGVGIAFKLVQGLELAGFTLTDISEEMLLDLVAIGTVADLAPLLNENRSLVHRGLEIIKHTPRPGVAALLKAAGVRQASATASTIGFALGPRINAAGRIDHAYLAARLLIASDRLQAHQLATQLDELNRRRQEQTREMTNRAEEMARAEADGAPLLFAVHEDFPSGIVGLIASRLQEKNYRPAIVAHQTDDVTVASCRSIPEFHITQALDQCQDLLVKHGGHAAAAGFTVKNHNLATLRDRLIAIAQQELGDRRLVPSLEIDAELALGDIIWEVQESLARLEPCGYMNDAPLLFSRNAQVVNKRTVGNDGAHLKLVLADGNHYFDAIAFRMGHLVDRVDERMDLVYYLEVNEWNGRVSLQLNIRDMSPVGEEIQ